MHGLYIELIKIVIIDWEVIKLYFNKDIKLFGKNLINIILKTNQ